MAAQVALTVESAIGLALESIVLVVLVSSKAFKTFLQRLFLWVVTALIGSEVTRVFSLAHHEMSPKVCTMLGFVHEWSWWSVYMFLAALIVCLFIKVCIQTGDNCTAVAVTLKNSKSSRMMLEIGIVLMLLALPMIVLWYPFHKNLYVHNGLRCLLNSSKGLPEEFEMMKGIIVYAPQNLAALVAIVVALCLTMQYHKLRQHKVARRILKKLILSLLIVFFFSIADNVMTLLGHFLKVCEFHYDMVRVCASLMITGAIKIVLLLGYLLGFHFSSKLCRGRGKHKVARQDDCDCNEYGTFRKSTRASAPSYTFFDPSHTADFESTSSSV